MNYLLDTNIISNIVKINPSPSLINWLSDKKESSLYISAMTIAEIRRGILNMPEGNRQRELENSLFGDEGILVNFANRILPFDEKTAMIWADLINEGSKAGKARGMADMIIAATAKVHNLIVVTDNEKDFWGIEIINPIRNNL